MKTPDYYLCGKYECMDIIRATQSRNEYIGFLDGNIKKYIWRWRNKGGINDLRKAKNYLELLIQVVNEKDE